MITDNKLLSYHQELSTYTKSRKWKSLSANEIVEYNLRSLDFDTKFEEPKLESRWLSIVFILLAWFPIFPFYCLFLIFFYLFFYLKRKKSNLRISCKNVFFIRNCLSENKIKLLKSNGLISDVDIVFDDFSFKGYGGIGLSSYLSGNIFDFIYRVSKEILFIINDTFLNLPKLSLLKLVKLIARVPHLILIDTSLDNMFTSETIDRLSSFEMISRFSSVMNRLVAKHSISEAVCFPHGLEYDIYYPNKYFGNLMYCTSHNARERLSIRYENIKFLFDRSIIDTLFHFELKADKAKKIVYFTDSRNVDDDFNNIDKIKDVVDLIKIHPRDSKSNYISIGVPFVDDFIDAISYRVIVMRPSTVIFEGENSGCIVFCLVTNDKENYMVKHLYPTLSDSKLKLKLLSSLSDTSEIIEARDV